MRKCLAFPNTNIPSYCCLIRQFRCSTSTLQKVSENYNNDSNQNTSVNILKRNEKQLLRKQRVDNNNLRGPSFKATYQSEMSKLKTSHEIENYLNKAHSFKLIPKQKMYIEAIICYGKMHEYDMAYSLFDKSKKDGNCKKDTYAAIMWLMCQQNRNVNTINHCIELMTEMKSHFGWKPSVNCYQVLLSNITTLRLYSHGIILINDIWKDNKDILRKSYVIRSSIVNFYSKSMHYEKALEFINKIKTEYGAAILNDSDYMFSSILSGIASMVNMESDTKSKQYHIKIAEKVFSTCWILNNRAPISSVFSSLIDVYANVGDIHSCLDIIDSMLKKDNYPNVSIITITTVFKALNDKMGYEYVWNVVDDLLCIVRENNIKKDVVFYTNIFSLFGKIHCDVATAVYNDDFLQLNKLKGFYDEMVRVDGLSPTEYTLSSLLMNGLSLFENVFKSNMDIDEKIKNELQEFVDWMLSEYKKYNVPLNGKMRQNLNKKMKYFCPSI